MTIQANDIDAEFSEHTMLSLVLAIFAFYVMTSLGLYLAKTLSSESFYSLALSFVLIVWTFKEIVIDFISPALLRLFGVGGQGYLHLLSLWFVDPRDLTLVGVASRVVAGSYTAILAAIFFIPLLFVVFIYLMNLYDALTPQATSASSDDSPNHQPPQTRIVSVSAEAPQVFEPEDVDEEDRWLVTEFDMDAFLVLCPLGQGVSSYVVLAKVDLSRSLMQMTPLLPQAGSLFAGGGDLGSKMTSNPSMESLPGRQEGSFWAESSTSSTKADDVAPLIDDSSSLKESKDDVLDEVLSEVEDKSEQNFIATKPKRAFGPGGEFPVKPLQLRGDGGWRKLEPGVPTSRLSPPVAVRSASVGIMSRKGSQAADLAQATLQRATSQTSSPHPSTIAGKMKMHSQSMTRLSELMRAGPDEGDRWWSPLQWLDEVQRKQSGMDEIFIVAPGLTESRVMSVSDLHHLDKQGPATVGSSSKSSLDRLKKENGSDREDGRRQSRSSLSRRQDDGDSNDGGDKKRMSAFPSVLSLTESEVMMAMSDHNNGNNNAGATEDETTGFRRLAGMEELPDLVAIKIMRKTDIERMNLRKTVENERRALAMCASPFVCNIFGAFQDAFWGYIILEPVPAGDLAGLIEQRNVMYEEEAVFYVGCLLLALEHLHARGIACMDVKPENLLLDQYGYCKLCDLGIAKLLSSPSKPNAHWEFVGTPEYMSPEVICGHRIASGTPGIAGPDLWACGILLFELLAGETPFTGETREQTAHKIQRFMKDETAAMNASRSRYQRWTSRVMPVGESPQNKNVTSREATSQMDEEEALPNSDELDRTFQPVNQVSLEAKDLIRSLLRSDPRKRLGCNGTEKEGARKVMDHVWFKKMQFDWRSLRRRETRAPFVPNPLTLAPPFRGEEVEVDITREKPLTVYELQQCQNFLKGHPTGGSQQEYTWKGYTSVASRPPVDRKSQGFLDNVRHVQRLFKDEMDG